jgi:hypothetical protein
MLSPAELLYLAQDLAARVPRTPEYSEERNRAWLAVGKAHLRFDDATSARQALENLDDPRVQAQFRLEAGKWAGEHLGSEAGRDMLRETVSQISTFERWLARNPLAELVPAVFKLLGADAVRSMARQLEDPFTAGNVLVTLSYQLADLAEKHEELRRAESLATTVRDGDRDWALRWVFSGYHHAGFTGDAERVRHMASEDPEMLTSREQTMLAEAESCLSESEKYSSPAPSADTQGARLRRFLGYKLNDLKVIFLTDACLAGVISDPTIEEEIRSAAFQRLEASRPARLGSDTSQLDAAGMAQFLFGRPVCQLDADSSLLTGEDYRDDRPDPPVFIRQITGLFRDFGLLSKNFSPEQIEQGLWFLTGHPFWFFDVISDEQVTPELRTECLRSMFVPFRDYYQHSAAGFAGSAFFMWWDKALDCRMEGYDSETQNIFIDVLTRILQLSSKECQFSALHGLNHMHPNPVAAATVRQYLEENRSGLTDDEIKWVETCAAGTAM